VSQPITKTKDTDNEVRTGGGRTAIEGADLLLLLTTLIWGINYPVVKYTLTDLIPINFAALRFLFGTIVMVPFALAAKQRLSIPRSDLLRIAALGFLANVCYQSLFVYGMKLSTAGDAAIMLATAPIFTAIIGRVRRQEFFGIQAVIGLVLAFAGISILVSFSGAGRKAGDPANHVAGNCILLCAAVCWASYTVGIKRFSHQYGSIKATTLMMLTGTPMLIIVSVPSLLRQDWHSVRTASWAGVAYSAVFSIAIAYIIWSYGVHRIGPTRTSIYSNITPIATWLAAWPLLGETPLPGQIVGAVIILAGVYLVRQGMTLAPAAGDPIEFEIEEETVRPG